MKTEQTKIVYTHWNRWTSYDVIKHDMITTDVILKCYIPVNFWNIIYYIPVAPDKDLNYIINS